MRFFTACGCQLCPPNVAAAAATNPCCLAALPPPLPLGASPPLTLTNDSAEVGLAREGELPSAPAAPPALPPPPPPSPLSPPGGCPIPRRREKTWAVPLSLVTASQSGHSPLRQQEQQQHSSWWVKVGLPGSRAGQALCASRASQPHTPSRTGIRAAACARGAEPPVGPPAGPLAPPACCCRRPAHLLKAMP